MQVEIVQFPRTPVAAFEYRGPADRENEAARMFVEWRIANRLPPDKHRTYGIHYNFNDVRPAGDGHVDSGDGHVDSGDGHVDSGDGRVDSGDGHIVSGESHIDICVSYDRVVAANPQGVVNKVIPELRCARARHLGSRDFNSTAFELYTTWLPASGEALGSFPWFFHYVNVGPNVQTREMITDVYLPLR